MIHIFHIFVKVTGWLPQKIVFRTKIFYQNKKVQGRKIKGPAILVSNHTTLFDFAIFMFVFLCRTLRYQMAELLFRGKFMGIFVRCLGGIYVDRDAHDYDCLLTSERILKKGGVVGVFPEGRIPTPKDVIRPLPFHPGVVQLALMTGVPIIPLFTNGCYF
ncbi:MAG: 1-acyl-sn-glycerol-3-phosphate acyltransferase, partial [Clostridia bacterium]|nr:1-acyl-sn-glycerol-3-phosphate acyltransferase [Clostridia bacterium]